MPCYTICFAITEDEFRVDYTFANLTLSLKSLGAIKSSDWKDNIIENNTFLFIGIASVCSPLRNIPVKWIFYVIARKIGKFHAHALSLMSFANSDPISEVFIVLNLEAITV